MREILNKQTKKRHKKKRVAFEKSTHAMSLRECTELPAIGPVEQ